MLAGVQLQTGSLTRWLGLSDRLLIGCQISSCCHNGFQKVVMRFPKKALLTRTSTLLDNSLLRPTSILYKLTNADKLPGEANTSTGSPFFSMFTYKSGFEVLKMLTLGPRVPLGMCQ